MGTHATIIAKQEDTYRAIYNHYDGYPEYLLKMLQEHYQDEDKVQRLIGLGDVSCVRREVDIPDGGSHTFSNPHTDITVAYGRDRGEKGTEYRTYSSLDKCLEKENQEFHYLWDGEWKPLA